MTMHALSRRCFIASAAAWIGGIVSTPGYAIRILSGRRPGDHLVAFYSRDFLAAQVIGRAYLRVAPGEADANLLAGILVRRDPALDVRRNPPDDRRIVGILRDRIAKDFETGHTVRIDGWVLSKTEARLCALCFLT